MPMKPCLCQDHSNNVTIITTYFYDNPSLDAVAFVLENRGKLVCFDCGGEVQWEVALNYDHVTATAVCGRLKDLGLLK